MIYYELVFIFFGFLKAFKPSEPFITPYLIDVKGLTKQQINYEIYPVWTYSFFALIIPIAFLAERLGYRPVIYLEVIGHLMTRFILIFGWGVRWMQVMQFTFGLACAGELVYYAYVFKVFPRQKHQMVTSFSRAAVLMGHCVGSLLGQLLIQFNIVHYEQLFWISAGTVGCASLISLWFPPYFRATQGRTRSNSLGSQERLHVKGEEEEEYEEKPGKYDEDESIASTASDIEETPLMNNGKEVDDSDQGGADEDEAAKKNDWFGLLHPLLIYALNLCHLYNLEGYTPILWKKILESQGVDKDTAKVWNGYADFGARGLGAVFAVLAWSILRPLRKQLTLLVVWRKALISVALILITLLTAALAFTTDIYSSYAMFVVACGLGGMISAVSSAWMGDAVNRVDKLNGKVAFVFGVSTFICAGIQSLMLAIVTKLEISIEVQLASYTAFIGVLTSYTLTIWFRGLRPSTTLSTES